MAIKLGDYVLVRTATAGVHVGTLASIDASAKVVTLTDARIVWYWAGAFTLHAIAEEGLDSQESKLSVPVAEVMLTEAVQIMPVTERAKATIDASPLRLKTGN
jgi:hypothetical protein